MAQKRKIQGNKMSCKKNLTIKLAKRELKSVLQPVKKLLW